MRPRWVLAALTAAAACLGGCVERGDFGRPKTHSVWNAALGAAGTAASAIRGEPGSPFALTDDERVLRDRAWRFLVPARDGAWFARALGELAATRILPPGAALAPPPAYAAALAAEGGVSPSSRFRRIGEDAAADLRLLPAITAVAERVATADAVRVKTLRHAGSVSPGEAEAAYGRVAENRCLLAWVREGLEARIAGYRYALERAVIETPQADAVPAERSLIGLERAGVAFAGFDLPPLPACTGDPRSEAPVAAPVALSARG